MEINTEILELENYFGFANIPKELKLNECTYITDLQKCIKNHLNAIHNYNSTLAQPYLNRLFKIKTKLQSNIIF